MSEEITSPFDAARERYFEILKPLFLPDDPVSHDIINYFASLLRVFGMEDVGWDPYAESRATLNDLNSFFKINLRRTAFRTSMPPTGVLGSCSTATSLRWTRHTRC